MSLQISEYLEMGKIVDNKEIKLPEIKKVKTLEKFTMIDSLENRESVRDYVDTSIKIDVLSVLLNYYFGIKKEKQNINGFKIKNVIYYSKYRKCKLETVKIEKSIHIIFNTVVYISTINKYSGGIN